MTIAIDDSERKLIENCILFYNLPLCVFFFIRGMTTVNYYKMESYSRNNSYVIPGVYDIEIQDAGWIMIASIMIFT